MNRQQLGEGFWKTFWDALFLDANLYEDAHYDPRSNQVALGIVLLAALSHALGTTVIFIINRVPWPFLLLLFVVNIASVMGGYYLWTLTIWKIGQWLHRESLPYDDLLSPIGFAYSPQALNFLTLIPWLGRPIELGLAVWSLLAVIVAVRQGLDISTRRSALICLIGWPLIQVAVGLVQVVEQFLMR